MAPTVPCSAPHSPMTTLKVISRGWGDDSIAQTLPRKQVGPEFNPHNPHKKPGVVIHRYTLLVPVQRGWGVGGEAGYPWGSLASQTSRADETPARLETLSPKQQGWEEGRQEEHDKNILHEILKEYRNT